MDPNEGASGDAEEEALLPTKEEYMAQQEDRLQMLKTELEGMTGVGVSAAYRCVTCGKLAYAHRGASVKGCKEKKLGLEALLDDVDVQIRQVAATILTLTQVHSAEAEGRRLSAAVERLEAANETLTSQRNRGWE